MVYNHASKQTKPLLSFHCQAWISTKWDQLQPFMHDLTVVLAMRWRCQWCCRRSAQVQLTFQLQEASDWHSLPAPGGGVQAQIERGTNLSSGLVGSDLMGLNNNRGGNGINNTVFCRRECWFASDYYCSSQVITIHLMNDDVFWRMVWCYSRR